MQRIISLLLATLLLVAVADRPAQAADGSHLSAAELKAAKQKERLSTIPIGGSVRDFAAWSGGADEPFSIASKAEPQPARITLVDRPGSVQTYIVTGSRGIRRTDPEYYALQVMNQVLGGGPQARLFLDLREEHGYTYGAYSNFNAEIYPGDWLAAAAVRTPVTDGSMTQFLYEFKRMNMLLGGRSSPNCLRGNIREERPGTCSIR
jgi:hypothetical protein